MSSFDFNNIISRLLVRYIPAAGSLWLSKLMLDKYSVNDYAVFALLVSFAALVPILDLGGGTKAVLVSGDPEKVAKLVSPPLFMCIALGVLWLISRNELIFSFFMLSIPVVLYVVARGNYAINGSDTFNKRALLFYPLGLVCVIAALELYARWVIYLTAIFVVYFTLIAGVRSEYIRRVGHFVRVGRWSDIIPDTASLKIVVLSVIAFIGAWSNVTYLKLFGTAADVQTYDLTWRMLAVTFFAQLYLSHSLPEIVRNITGKSNNYNSTILLHHSILNVLLILAQFIVVALIFPLYAKFFNFDPNWRDVAAGLFMCFIFGMIIPINQVLLATARFKILICLFGASALASVGLKFFIEPSTQNAFLSSGLGYLIALVAGSFIIIKQSVSND